MPNYTEKDFEAHIEDHLIQSGYQALPPKEYDRKLCMIPAEVLAFLQATQPKPYQALLPQYGEETGPKLLQRLEQEIKKHGTLHLLRKGFSDRGSHFQMAFFQPASGLNPEHQQQFQQNRFGVMRQLHYSLHNENALDMVLFLNGLPLVTMELKNSLTGQTVEQAIRQYREDRDPQEALLKFKRCLVHFAVGNEKIFMTTQLEGKKTQFLPFNLDTENPPNPQGHKTAYLWEKILQPESLLDLINNYLHIQTTSEKTYKDKGLIEKESSYMIFPRFHQLDVVRKLLHQIKQEGVGHNYLIQHSAGSGKSNSIAWLAHQLANLYQTPQDSYRLFDSVIVVTDRVVLDRQLQNTIKQFEQTQGVVCPINANSAQLREALEAGKDIIITTIQKFPVISESITELKGKRFAVIVDEAHASQSGETSKHLKQSLSFHLDQAQTQEEAEDFDLDETLLHEIQSKGPQAHISYFAFTATPKNKTLELFGRKPAKDQPPAAFHFYTMRQAIEEGFILDVLQNYTTFQRYFKILKNIDEDKEYETSKAIRLLTSYVDLQPHAIRSKIEIILEHFLRHTAQAIKGQGRAMIVTRSRLHAVKYYLELNAQMQAQDLPYRPLVAFSGTVQDQESGAEYTEAINGLSSHVSLQDAFKMPDYRIMVVANKFQTGYDEPLLHTMYVDRKLGGLQAVQTLSRLNRVTSGKTETLVLDFVNQAEEIQEAFQPYYQKTFLAEETDPNKLHDLQSDLAAFGLYSQAEVRSFAEIFLNPQSPKEKLQPLLDQVVVRWDEKSQEEREDFRSHLQSYLRLYGFLSQVISFQSLDLEALYLFAYALNRKLPKRDGHLPTEILEAVDLDSFRLQKTFEAQIKLHSEDGQVQGMASGSSVAHDPAKELLSIIVENLNKSYGVNLSEEDKLDLQSIQEKLEVHEELQGFMNADNTPANKKQKFDEILEGLFLEFVQGKFGFYQKMSKHETRQALSQIWFEHYQKAQSKALRK